MSITPVRLPEARSESIRREGLKVFVRGLRVQAAIGVHDHERGRFQPLLVEIEADLGELVVERYADTVDYETLADHARTTAAAGHVDLVEEYVETLARACLADPRIRAVRVRAEKPEAVNQAEGAGCELVLRRD